MPKTSNRNKPSLYQLKVVKKGTEALPLILSFVSRRAYIDTWSKIVIHRKDLEIVDEVAAVIYESSDEALEICDIFLR